MLLLFVVTHLSHRLEIIWLVVHPPDIYAGTPLKVHPWIKDICICIKSMSLDFSLKWLYTGHYTMSQRCPYSTVYPCPRLSSHSLEKTCTSKCTCSTVTIQLQSRLSLCFLFRGSREPGMEAICNCVIGTYDIRSAHVARFPGPRYFWLRKSHHRAWDWKSRAWG